MFPTDANLLWHFLHRPLAPNLLRPPPLPFARDTDSAARRHWPWLAGGVGGARWVHNPHFLTRDRKWHIFEANTPGATREMNCHDLVKGGGDSL